MIARADDRLLFAPRALLSVLLLSGAQTAWVLLAMSVHSIFVLHRFNGPYNGGSDRMGLLILYCMCLAHLVPQGAAREAVFGYLAMQVVLSYLISGWVKIVNPDWRSGRALRDVFLFSSYPVSEDLRRLADHKGLLWVLSWAVILLELLFPFALLHPVSLLAALALALSFHVANGFLFGLNRFVWFWCAAYPSLLWLQGRVVFLT